jgi:hypothetical protein
MTFILKFLGRRLNIMEYAVDPVADYQLVVIRFDMDIARPALRSPGNEKVDKFDDGRFRCQILEMPDVLSLPVGQLESLVIDILDDLIDILGLLAVVPGNVIVDQLSITRVCAHIGIQGDPEGVDDRLVIRIGHEDLEDIILQLQGNDPVFPDEPGGETVQYEGNLRKRFHFFITRRRLGPRLHTLSFSERRRLVPPIA